MMVAVLLGALTLGACVDDNESQSVTDVRNAKTEQLKAMAALDKAKAEAELIAANAEKALKEAQAEYQKSLAAAEQAEAELKQQQKEQAAQRFVLEIQRLEAETSEAVARAKQQIANYENTIATENNTKLTTLFSNYSTALGELVTLNQTLTGTQASIAYLEAGVEYAKAYAKTQITNNERNIAGYNAQLEVLKDPANTNIDDKEMYAKWQAAAKKAALAWNAVHANEGVAAKEAGDAVKAAWEVMDMDLVNAANSRYSVIDYTYGDYVEYVNSIYVNKMGLGSLKENFRVNESNKLTADRYFASNVAAALDNLGTSADAKDKNTAYGRLAAANAALADAKAMPETTDAEKAAKKTAIEQAETSVASAKDNLANDQTTYNHAVAEKKAFDDAFAAIDIAAYNDASAAIVAALDKQDEAIETYNKAAETPNELSAEATALQNLYNNATNIDEQIVQLEANIASANKQIEYYKGTYVTDSETALVQANQEIENLKAKIAAQTKIVDAAKTALDAALAE